MNRQSWMQLGAIGRAYTGLDDDTVAGWCYLNHGITCSDNAADSGDIDSVDHT
jgi:hypothetical protein